MPMLLSSGEGGRLQGMKRRSQKRHAVILVVLFVASGSGDSGSPTAPSDTPTRAPTPFAVTGTVGNRVSGEARFAEETIISFNDGSGSPTAVTTVPAAELVPYPYASGLRCGIAGTSLVQTAYRTARSQSTSRAI